MSRIPKWKIEKTKVKVVFRLQFQATDIPQPGWDKLFVSLISNDSGKVTAKTSKSSVRNGSCKWSDPIYETTRLLQDPKTKDYDEKLYTLVVAMGSSRSSLLGEVIINLADFVDALKPSSAALPLHGCDFGTMLHVTVQLLTSKTGFREFEQQRELSVKGFQASSAKRIHDQSEDLPATSGSSERVYKVNARVRFKGDSTVLPSLEEVGELVEDHEDLAAGVDGSSYTSESLSTEKNDFSGSTELDGLKSKLTGNVVGLMTVHGSSAEKGDHNYKHLSTQLSNDWSHGWSSDYSIDNDMVSTCEESDRLTARLEVTESSVLQLTSEAKSLQNISDVLASETQILAQQFAVELASGEKLVREVDMLKTECRKFKIDLDELKAASASRQTPRTETPPDFQVKCFSADASFENKLVDSAPDVESNIPRDFQSKLLQGIFLIECKVQQMQNNACFLYNGNGFDDICLEFDHLGSLIQNLKQSIVHELSKETVSGIQTTKNQYSLVSLSNQDVQVQDAGSCFTDLYYSEGIKKEKLCEVFEQLEISKTEDDSFAKRMANVECYYEAIIHELEERQTQTSDQLENVRAEHSSCFYTISALQSQTEKLHEELNGQLIRFTEDRRNLESFINELEKRAISSETMLKRVRWNYAIAVDRLQKDLELLSFQILSMYEANESLAKQAFADATEQYCDEHSEDMQLCHSDEFFVSSNKKQQKPARGEIQHGITWANSDNDSCTMVNGVSEKLNHKLLHNFSSKEETKGTTESGLSMGLEHANVNIFSAAALHDIIQERKDLSLSRDSLLEELKDSSLLCSLNAKKPIDHFQISNNLEYIKDVYHYSPAENSQIKNTETKDYAYPPPELLDSIVCLKEREMPVDVLKHFLVGSEAEISEVHMLNLQSEVYAQVLQETLREVFPEINHLNGEVFNLQKKMKHCTDNNDFLVRKLNTVLDECRTLREAKEKDMTRYNDLVSINHVMERKLNEILDEKNLLIQKVEDHHSLIANSRFYESKYKICFEEKNELELMLKEEKSQRAYFLSEINSLIEELRSLKEHYENKCSLNSDLQESVTDLQGKLRDLCNWIILHNQQVDSIFGDITVTEELDSENYDAIISHLEQFQQKVSRLLRFQQEKTVLEEQLEVAQCKLNERESHILYMKQKFESELGELSTKLELSRTEIQYLQIEFQDTIEKFKLSKETEEWHRQENAKLLSSISIMEVKLQQATHEWQNLCQQLVEEYSVDKEVLVHEKKDSFFFIQSGNETSIKMEYELSRLKDGLHYAHDWLLMLQQGKKTAEEQRKVTQCTLNERELHILHMKQKFESELEEVRTKLEHSRIEVQHLHIELQDVLEKLKLSKKAEESHILENRKLLSNMSVLEFELQKSTDKCREFYQKLLDAENLDGDLAKTKSRLADLLQENKELLSFVQSGNEASVKLEHELSSLKDSLHYAQNKLLSERKCREELEISLSDLKLQALEMSQKLLAVNEQNAELCYLKTRAFDLKKNVRQCVVSYKERDRKIDSETSSPFLEVASVEDELVAAFEHLISADVELTFMKDHFYSKMENFVVHQKKSENILEELHLKHLDGVASLQKYIISESVLVAERERLSTELLSSKSMIEVLFGKKETLVDANIVIRAEFEDLKSKVAISEASFAKEKQHYEDELWLAKVELDMIVVFLHSKLSEQVTLVAVFEECRYALKNLREQHIELNQKFSEQILKTEEFKNLSIHLRELKDNADSECHQVRERRESEGSSFTVQESLRIAFIKEQYESKIQELRNQCAVSRRYEDEMLMKLQSSLNDNEERKKSEASLTKKNEAMSATLSDLDTELQTVVNDRRDFIKTYDRMKAELECTILSLECCKEEKQKLQNCLKESNEEREKIRVELDLVKRLLENIASTTGIGVGRNYESDNPDSRLIGELLDDDPSSTSFMYDNASTTLSIFSEDKVVKAGKDLASVRLKSSPCREVENARLTSINRDSFMSVGKMEKILKEATVEPPILFENNATQIADIKEHFREQQRVINDMEILRKQLQRLKNDNILSQCQLQEDHFDADLQHLHRELLQLDMVNEELENIFPTYKMLSSYGNALERVLSLELELAKALQVKKKPGTYIQSSFLKQHSDDEAVFQSFKDINELIKDMIDLKRRNVTIETELQEMHGRYSQLSLQFAEVEGERQKLIMSLKSRTTKKS